LESFANLIELDKKYDNLHFHDIKDIDDTLLNVESKVIDIMRTQNFQMFREDEYSKKQISNYMSLLYLTIAQIFLIVICTIWQFSKIKPILMDLLNKA
jgi:hypothetical protein